MIGGFLQADGRLGRESAQDFSGPETGLAGLETCGNLIRVVAVHLLRTGTGSLNRYPSPDGRSALPLGSPPIFFALASVFSSDRQSLAHFDRNGGSAFAGASDVASSGAGIQHNMEGYQECRLRNGSRVPYAPLRSQGVGTRRLNKASSVQAQARVRLSCWTATRLPVPLSAARPTLSIASATPRAAEDVAGLTPRITTRTTINHRIARRSGGFLLCEEPSFAGRCPRGQEPEGT